jgi:hypothetical protein
MAVTLYIVSALVGIGAAGKPYQFCLENDDVQIGDCASGPTGQNVVMEKALSFIGFFFSKSVL